MISIAPIAAVPRGTAVAIPADLPAPAAAGAATTFPEALPVRPINQLPGIVSTTGDERCVGTVDPSSMIPIGRAYLPAVAAAVAQSRAGSLSTGVAVDHDAMIGVFQAHDGSLYLGPILVAASDRPDMLVLSAGDTVTPTSAQLVAVADAAAWVDLRG